MPRRSRTKPSRSSQSAAPTGLTAQEARRLDLNSEELGVAVSRLMARAGKALAQEVLHQLPGQAGKAGLTGQTGEAAKAASVLFFCGKGNNGGDGLAAAALLQSMGHNAWVVLAEPKARILHPAPRAYLGMCDAKMMTEWKGQAEPAWDGVHLLVDCMLGTGQTGKLRAPYDAIARWMNSRRAHATLIACDVPTGMGSKSAVKPHLTVTLHARKQGMTNANSGKIVVAPIGIPRAAETQVGIGDFALGYIRPKANSHKGDNGVVLILAGSKAYAGAPRYCGMGAYRTGSDLVYAVVPADVAATVQSFGPEVMVHESNPGPHSTPESATALRKLAKRATAMVVGPGLGNDPQSIEAARQALKLAEVRKIPVVVDADGLAALTPAFLRRHGKHTVLTPHAGEFRKMTGKSATPRNVVAYAKRNQVTVLCKGVLVPNVHASLITDGTRSRESRRGHATMSVGGTGDVLAGTVAALLAKGAVPFEAACAGAYITGCAGEVMASLRSYGATAVDLHEAIPAVLLRLPR